MTDRRELVEAHVLQLSTHLGYPEPPPVVFEEPSFGQPVAFEGLDIRDPKTPRRIENPKLRVSPSSLKSLTDRELAYMLTLTLVSNSPQSKEEVQVLGVVMLAPPLLALLSVVALSLKYGPLWLFSLPAVLVCIPVGFVFVMMIMDRQIKRKHLEAIDITGDAVTAVSILRASFKDRRPWQRGRETWLARSVRREAEKRGYRTQPQLDH